jgi:hypothetical protein
LWLALANEAAGDKKQALYIFNKIQDRINKSTIGPDAAQFQARINEAMFRLQNSK